MAKYYYKKYNINTSVNEVRTEVATGSFEVNGQIAQQKPAYKNYNLVTTETEKAFKVQGDSYVIGSTGAIFYTSTVSSPLFGQLNNNPNVSGQYLIEIISFTVRNIGGQLYYTCQYKSYKNNSTITFAKGTYITEVIAEDGAYPTNGRHTDGYWYMKDRVATVARINDNGTIKNIGQIVYNDNGTIRKVAKVVYNDNGVIKEVR